MTWYTCAHARGSEREEIKQSDSVAFNNTCWFQRSADKHAIDRLRFGCSALFGRKDISGGLSPHPEGVDFIMKNANKLPSPASFIMSHAEAELFTIHRRDNKEFTVPIVRRDAFCQSPGECIRKGRTKVLRREDCSSESTPWQRISRRLFMLSLSYNHPFMTWKRSKKLIPGALYASALKDAQCAFNDMAVRRAACIKAHFRLSVRRYKCIYRKKLISSAVHFSLCGKNASFTIALFSLSLTGCRRKKKLINFPPRARALLAYATR